MAAFRMQHAVKQAAIDPDAHPHAGSDGDINDTVKAFGAAVSHFTQTGAVHIRVKAHRYAKGLFQVSHQVLVSPCQLG